MARSGVEEMLRYVSPVQLTGRALTEDCEFGGVAVRSRRLRHAAAGLGQPRPGRSSTIPSASTSPAAPNNHLGFGFGIHHCLGAPLARMETQVALTSLVRRAPDLALTVDDVTYKTNVVLRGMEALPVSMRG